MARRTVSPPQGGGAGAGAAACAVADQRVSRRRRGGGGAGRREKGGGEEEAVPAVRQPVRRRGQLPHRLRLPRPRHRGEGVVLAVAAAPGDRRRVERQERGDRVQVERQGEPAQHRESELEGEVELLPGARRGRAALPPQPPRLLRRRLHPLLVLPYM